MFENRMPDAAHTKENALYSRIAAILAVHDIQEWIIYHVFKTCVENNAWSFRNIINVVILMKDKFPGKFLGTLGEIIVEEYMKVE